MKSFSSIFSLPALCSLHDRFAGRMGAALTSSSVPKTTAIVCFAGFSFDADEDIPVCGRESLMETIAFDESDNLDK